MVAVSERKSLSFLTGSFLSVEPIFKATVLAAATSYLVIFLSAAPVVEVGSMYSGVFDLTAIFAGFLATFYVFVVTRGNTFLERIKHTVTFMQIIKLLKFTLIWSGIVIAYSYVLMVVEPKGAAYHSAMHFVIFFWLCNVFAVVVNFARCARQFVSIVEA